MSEEKVKKIRRSRKDVVIANIEKVDKKIEEYTAKITELRSEKDVLQKELTDLLEKEDKAKQEAEMKEMMSLIKKKNISMDELKAMLESK